MPAVVLVTPASSNESVKLPLDAPVEIARRPSPVKSPCMPPPSSPSWSKRSCVSPSPTSTQGSTSVPRPKTRVTAIPMIPSLFTASATVAAEAFQGSGAVDRAVPVDASAWSRNVPPVAHVRRITDPAGTSAIVTVPPVTAAAFTVGVGARGSVRATSPMSVSTASSGRRVPVVVSIDCAWS